MALTGLVYAHPQVHVYFKRFDDAEVLYRQMDRLDLAINLRSRLGDWFKVEKLLRESGGDDVALVTAWNKIGAYYSDRHKWAKAAHFYTQVETVGSSSDNCLVGRTQVVCPACTCAQAACIVCIGMHDHK
jgi:hypothetical protein